MVRLNVLKKKSFICFGIRIYIDFKYLKLCILIITDTGVQNILLNMSVDLYCTGLTSAFQINFNDKLLCGDFDEHDM